MVPIPWVCIRKYNVTSMLSGWTCSYLKVLDISKRIIQHVKEWYFVFRQCYYSIIPTHGPVSSVSSGAAASHWLWPGFPRICPRIHGAGGAGEKNTRECLQRMQNYVTKLFFTKLFLCSANFLLLHFTACKHSTVALHWSALCNDTIHWAAIIASYLNTRERES